MGACMSTEDFSAVVLVPPATPITAVDSKFVTLTPLSLNIRHNDWVNTGEYTIKDVITGVAYFTVEGFFFTAVDRKTLKDVSGGNIATVETPPFGFGRRDVYTTDAHGNSARLLYSFEVTNIFGSTDLSCQMKDQVTGQTHTFTCLGSVGSWNLVIFCDGKPVAKYRSDWELGGDRYLVDIAPGVDIAMIVLFCVGIQEASE
ncbi:hypothetical protein ACHHYP_15675 [Achlya hypogyna]|uniref:Uncharacterized protein n=1 Tax=Achlya hypogyna TaxID=1202772 RepID=A0A1V9YA94_ACHHY|nr:hypothetical protein ACHHYP_15675 [Achlya hypogyna]